MNAVAIRNISKQFYRQYSFTSKTNAIHKEPVSFVSENKTTFINRLHCWGNAGTGALGM